MEFAICAIINAHAANKSHPRTSRKSQKFGQASRCQDQHNNFALTCSESTGKFSKCNSWTSCGPQPHYTCHDNCQKCSRPCSSIACNDSYKDSSITIPCNYCICWCLSPTGQDFPEIPKFLHHGALIPIMVAAK